MSFSSELKETLLALPVKKRCCQHILAASLALDKTKHTDLTEEMRTIREKCRCAACLPHLLRGLFIRFGSVTDPEKAYHLDFSFRYEAERDYVASLLQEAELNPRCSVRGERYLVYFKSGVEDVLAYLGASTVAFDLMNRKIVRELRSSANRQVNCDTANIERQLAASQKYEEAIAYLTETGEIVKMPAVLQDTIRLKQSYPQSSLEDLGLLANPPVSKSGLRHRLEKIYQYYLDRKHEVDGERGNAAF